MAEKKSQSLINRLPSAGANGPQSDLKFRFSRVVPGDHLDAEGKGSKLLEQQELTGRKADVKDKINELVPPPGVPPPTAADVLKCKKKEVPLDYCKPVEYQNLPDAKNPPETAAPDSAAPSGLMAAANLPKVEQIEN